MVADRQEDYVPKIPEVLSEDNPVRLVVGIAAPGGWRLGGHLAVSHNKLECQLGSVSGRLAHLQVVHHESRVVDVYHARLIPFWFNVSVVIDNGTTRVLASTWSFGLRRLVRVLRSAGFDVTIHQTWKFRGLSMAEILQP
jgi:hypothetical protein